METHISLTDGLNALINLHKYIMFKMLIKIAQIIETIIKYATIKTAHIRNTGYMRVPLKSQSD